MRMRNQRFGRKTPKVNTLWRYWVECLEKKIPAYRLVKSAFAISPIPSPDLVGEERIQNLKTVFRMR